MTADELKRRMQKCNLSELSRLTGIDARTLRWIRNTSRTPKPEMIARIKPHLAAARV